MKFLITVASYYPVPGGVQMVTKYTAERLVEKGHEVTVITSSYDRNDYLQEINGVKLLYTDVYKKFDVIKGDKKGYIDLVFNNLSDKDVMINVSLQTPTTDLLLPFLEKIKCKKILYLHDIYDFKWHKFDLKSLSTITRKVYYNITRKVYYHSLYKKISKYDLITHLSPFDFSLKYVMKHNITQNIILGNAALDSIFESKIINEKNNKYFICIANYNERKNQKLILEAFYSALLPNDVSLIFVGKEKNIYFDSLILLKNKLDKKFGIKNVEFKVGISRLETENLLANACCLVLGSTLEMFPVVIIEAMASKIPFISTDVGCVKYQPGGFIVHDQDEMSYWMKFVIDNPVVANNMGLVGYTYAINNMTIESKVNCLIESIKKI